MLHKMHIDGLVKLRLLSNLISGALATICGAFAIKALVDLANDKKLLLQLLNGKIVAGDIVGANSAMVGSAIFSALVSFMAFNMIYWEQKGRVGTKLRIMTECLLAFGWLALLGSTIATTYICLTRSAVAHAPNIPDATLVKLIEATQHRTLAYRKTYAYQSMIVGWPCTLFLFLDLVLLIVAGLRFRKAARERRASAAHGGEFISDTKEAGSHHETSA